MAHKFLKGLLEELDKDEFETFQWTLRNNSEGKVTKYQMDGANRRKTVDVMIETYTADGAVKITKSILEENNMNVLAEKCKVQGASPAQTLTKTQEDKSAVEKLRSGRNVFIQGVSDASMNLLLDNLMLKNVINDGEMESIRGETLRSEKARVLVDMVRRKGNKACSEMLDILRPLEPDLSEQLCL